MKFLLIAMVLLLAACSSKVEQQFTSEVNFNIKGGFYESMKVITWEEKKPVCAALAIVEPDYGTKWLPAARFNFLSEDEKYTASIMLAPHAKGDKDLQLIYTLYNKEDESENVHTVIADHLKFSKSVPIEIFFSGDRGLGIHLENSGKIFNLPFEPKSFVISASSAKSAIKFSTDTCAISQDKNYNVDTKAEPKSDK